MHSPSSRSLVDEFFNSSDANESTRDLLRVAFTEREQNKGVLRRELNFNLFDVVLDFENDVAVVSDVVVSDDGEEVMPLALFKSRLDKAN